MSKLRVWVRDEDPTLEQALAAVLRTEGFEVSTGAQQRSSAPEPDVVVLGLPAPPDAPDPALFAPPVVLLVEGSALAELAAWFEVPGRRTVLYKPVRERDLVRAVQHAAGVASGAVVGPG